MLKMIGTARILKGLTMDEKDTKIIEQEIDIKAKDKRIESLQSELYRLQEEKAEYKSKILLLEKHIETMASAMSLMNT